MCTITLTIIFIIIILTFYFLNNYMSHKENFCYGNVYCNGNKDNALCISQKCKPCGLNAQCNDDTDCGPNNCIDGCCDGN
jgi:hypothetical protein